MGGRAEFDAAIMPVNTGQGRWCSQRLSDVNCLRTLAICHRDLTAAWQEQLSPLPLSASSQGLTIRGTKHRKKPWGFA